MVATIAQGNGVQMMTELAALAGKSLEFPPSRHGKSDAVHDVVMVAAGIGDQFCRLRLANLVRGPRHYDVRALALWQEARAESAKGEAADVFPERCRHPSLAAVRRNLDGSNAVATV